MRTDIDVTFDFRLDAPQGKDPDAHSKTLRRYHKLLWSKRLPCGAFFGLDDTIPGHYLYHRSAVGDFSLSSDAVIPTFRWHKQIQTLIPEEKLKDFIAAGYTIGGMMVFPGNRIDGKWTINQARGCTRRIGDRFDLTVECIRRHYSNGKSPLSDVLTRYVRFFDLFGSFRGYVEFFLLHDLVSADSAVYTSAPFDDFNGSPIPNGVTSTERTRALRVRSSKRVTRELQIPIVISAAQRDRLASDVAEVDPPASFPAPMQKPCSP